MSAQHCVMILFIRFPMRTPVPLGLRLFFFVAGTFGVLDTPIFLLYPVFSSWIFDGALSAW